MKKKIVSCLTFAIMFISLGLCLVGCSNNSKLTKIYVSGNMKTEYYLGEKLDVTGGKITLVFDDYSEKEVSLVKSMVSEFNSSTAGEKTMTITYGDEVCSFEYTVVNAYKIGDYKLTMGSYYEKELNIYASDGTKIEKDSKSYAESYSPFKLVLNADGSGTFTQYGDSKGSDNVYTANIEWSVVNKTLSYYTILGETKGATQYGKISSDNEIMFETYDASTGNVTRAVFQLFA